MGKFCTNCGKPLEGNGFCTNCGKPAIDNYTKNVFDKVKGYDYKSKLEDIGQKVEKTANVTINKIQDKVKEEKQIKEEKKTTEQRKEFGSISKEDIKSFSDVQNDTKKKDKFTTIGTVLVIIICILFLGVIGEMEETTDTDTANSDTNLNNEETIIDEGQNNNNDTNTSTSTSAYLTKIDDNDYYIDTDNNIYLYYAYRRDAKEYYLYYIFDCVNNQVYDVTYYFKDNDGSYSKYDYQGDLASGVKFDIDPYDNKESYWIAKFKALNNNNLVITDHNGFDYDYKRVPIKEAVELLNKLGAIKIDTSAVTINNTTSDNTTNNNDKEIVNEVKESATTKTTSSSNTKKQLGLRVEQAHRAVQYMADYYYPYGVKIHWFKDDRVSEQDENGWWYFLVGAEVTNEYGTSKKVLIKSTISAEKVETFKVLNYYE